ncbi:MAG: PEGA domain-containing protein [Calditrichaceae bacterium]
MTRTLLVVILFSAYLQAQNLSQLQIVGKAEKSSDEMTGVKDENGRFCAAICIISDMDGFSYDAYNGVVKVDDQPGRDIIYLSPDERVLEVFHNGFQPKQIILSEEGIQLAPRAVFVIKISADSKYNSRKGHLLLTTNPAGANIQIDGIPGFNRISPYRFENLSAQTWKFIITKAGYVTHEMFIKVQDGKTVSQELTLTPTFGYITISLSHDDALLFINDKEITFSPDLPVAVPEGRILLRLEKPYYHPFTYAMEIVPNDDPVKSIPIQANLIRKEGNLIIDSKVPETEIYLDNNYIGSTPISRTVPAGQYKLEARKRRHRSDSLHIDVTGDRDLNLRVAPSPNGLFTVKGTSGASIFINDRYRGSIPMYEMELDPGKYSIRIEKDGYDTKNKSFSIDSRGKEREYELVKTRNRFFRLTAFGNGRISDISNGLLISFGGYYWQLPPEMLNEITQSNEISDPLDDYGYIGDISIYLNPLTIGGSFRFKTTDLNTSSVEKDSLATYSWTGYLGFTPFVLWETLYPSAGAFIGENYFYNEIDGDQVDKVKQTTYGYYADLRIQLDYHFFLKAVYQQYRDDHNINESANIQFGILFGGGPSKKATDKK